MQRHLSTDIHITDADQKILDDHFFVIALWGDILAWTEWFITRCREKNVDVSKTLTLYTTMIHAKELLRSANNFIDATQELQKQFDTTFVDQLRLCDLYEDNYFWKTKLGHWVYHGKQEQNSWFINDAITVTKGKIINFIQENNVDALCFIPSSITREIQLMNELKKWLAVLSLPEIQLEKKPSNGVLVAQKTLHQYTQRRVNAEKTLEVVGSPDPVNTLLIIDDFVRSWATINVAADKIRRQWLAKNIYCISLLGNTDFTQKISNEV